jgi:hypothetical protein
MEDAGGEVVTERRGTCRKKRGPGRQCPRHSVSEDLSYSENSLALLEVFACSCTWKHRQWLLESLGDYGYGSLAL